MTRQLRGRLKWLKNDLKTEQKGLDNARVFCVLLKKPFTKSTSYKAYTQGVRDTKRQLAQLSALIKRRQDNGQCYKIL